jgi:lysophospholipid acyltransferase (LPLAT)-like uncharacterized protein
MTSGDRIGERLKGLLISGAGGRLVTSLMRSAHFGLIAGADVEREIVVPRLPAVYVLWHGRLLPCSYYWRGLRLATLISRNRDGDHISRVVEGWGYEVLRGSSSRGGSLALLQIVRALRRGTPVALTPDGPRGPRRKMKLGPLLAAQKAAAPIVPVAAGATAAWFFGRWDRFLVPKPFAWIPCALAEPVRVDPAWGVEELEACAAEVEIRLNRLTDQVDEAARARR